MRQYIVTTNVLICFAVTAKRAPTKKQIRAWIEQHIGEDGLALDTTRLDGHGATIEVPMYSTFNNVHDNGESESEDACDVCVDEESRDGAEK